MNPPPAQDPWQGNDAVPPDRQPPPPGYVQPGQPYGQPMDAYGQPVDAYGQPWESTPGRPAEPYPPTTAFPPPKPPKPPSRWKAWHKVTLGVIGALSLCVCGIAVFAPDSNSGDPAGKERTAAAQQLADVPSTEPATTEPATTEPATAAPTTKPVTVAPATKPAAKPTTKPAAKPSTTKAVYYATCEDAPGPLRKGQPGYRKALDRDKDGVACEQGGGDEEPPAEEPGDDSDSGGGTDPRYSSCTKAKAAGYGPYYEGQDPEYDWYQDRDGDGVVCE
ncbi:excalibur calcium-binding domain-containing protein [Actinoplanes sp. NPDC048796]|uniref:excalibur calcium-binding domain-containing protein n=1 Tax=Actinoplanes sp. NPDC048796 TaxID=3155640 RepID=UPI003404A7D3